MKVMLAAKADLEKLRFPLLASPKLDGIRAVVLDGVVYSRNMKPIPNKHVQDLFGRPQLHGVDGELIVGAPYGEDVFRRATSGVMSVEGKPEVTFHLFDHVGEPDQSYLRRVKNLERVCRFFPYTTAVHHEWVNDLEELGYLARMHLESGFEGTMLRDPNAPYKFGRSTAREGGLLKLKVFEDSEAKIVGYECQYRNDNEAVRNGAGVLEKSAAKDGRTPLNRLGNVTVIDIHTRAKFNVGVGFTDEERIALWQRPKALLGRVIRYRYFPSGSKDKPRFPTFEGFREDI